MVCNFTEFGLIFKKKFRTVYYLLRKSLELDVYHTGSRQTHKSVTVSGVAPLPSGSCVNLTFSVAGASPTAICFSINRTLYLNTILYLPGNVLNQNMISLTQFRKYENYLKLFQIQQYKKFMYYCIFRNNCRITSLLGLVFF